MRATQATASSVLALFLFAGADGFAFFPLQHAVTSINIRDSVGPQPLASTKDPIIEVLTDEDDDDGDSEEDWLPDREKARRKRLAARIHVERVKEETKQLDSSTSTTSTEQSSAAAPEDSQNDPAKSSPYTIEEEHLIASMGGKTFHPERKREEGFLGDSTLQEIAQDYSIPICYLADVLCTWGVPVPIHPQERLGDLVTGEQAFAILEAVNSLDVGQVQDRYSNTCLIDLCTMWDIGLQEAFEFAMKEGWSLPFGVQTCLRVEQEDELLRLYAAI